MGEVPATYPNSENEVGQSLTPPPSPQNTPLQYYEEEVTSVLENMGIFSKGREQSENFEEQNCTPNQSTSTHSP